MWYNCFVETCAAKQITRNYGVVCMEFGPILLEWCGSNSTERLCCPLVANTRRNSMQEPCVGRLSMNEAKVVTYHRADIHAWLPNRYGVCHHDVLWNLLTVLEWRTYRRRWNLKFILMRQEKGKWGEEALNASSEWKNAPAFPSQKRLVWTWISHTISLPLCPGVDQTAFYPVSLGATRTTRIYSHGTHLSHAARNQTEFVMFTLPWQQNQPPSVWSSNAN